MDKLLTIAIPTYKKANELKRSLEALSLQYDERLEIIVSDDASPDNTAEIVAEMQKKIPIKYYKNESNLGFDRHYLKCYRRAIGKYIMLMGNDDFLMDGGVSHILDYLEEYKDIDWVFVNYSRYYEKDGNLFWLGTDVPVGGDKSYISKKEFLSFTSISISTLTSIVRRDKALQIKDYNEFLNTAFLALGIPFTITAPTDSHLGIIGKPLIAYNTPRDEKISDNFFKYFGTGLRFIMCVVAPRCGYDMHTVRKAYRACFMSWKHKIIRLRAEAEADRRNLFWKDGFPAVRDYISAWFTVIPLALMPHFIAVFMVNYIKPLYHKIKNLNIRNSASTKS